MKKHYTKNEIKNLSYTDFISLIREENRPSGGKITIKEIVKNSFLNKYSKVLEIGCTNGFSSIEINKLINCINVGIDININSIKNANDRILKNNLDPNRISFKYGDAEKLEFKDNYFDMIVCGNAISFIQNKENAINEIKRVLKPNGMISIVPIWYKEEPDYDIIKNVNKELGFEINISYEEDWSSYEKWGLELYYKKDYNFLKRSYEEIKKYSENLIYSKNHLNIYSEEEKRVIIERWTRIMSVFAENLAMTKFSVILLRKNSEKEEEELFLTSE